MKLLHKKRGNRTSVPALTGSLVEALVDAALTLVGSTVLAVVAVDLTFRVIEQRDFPSGWTLTLVVLPAVLCVGVGLFRLSSLVFHSALTVERRRMMIDRARSDHTRSDVAKSQASTSFPAVPDIPGIHKDSGTRARYRLPVIDDQLRPLANLGSLGLLASIASTAAIAALLEKPFSLPTTIALIVAAGVSLAAGIWAVCWFVIRLFRWYRCGPTCIELAAHPFVVGTTVELFIRQSDRARWRRIHVVLECWEEAVFHQGTDVRRESRRVAELTCQLEELPTTREGQFRDFRAVCQLPIDLMHSFSSGNNSIQWRIRVKARAKHSVTLDREAPVVLLPPAFCPVYEAPPRPIRRFRSATQAQETR